MINTVSFPGLGLQFHLSNVAFQIGSFSVYWYGVLIGLGVVLALIYAFHYAKTFGVDANRMSEVIIFGMFGALIGARLFYVIFNWGMFQDNPLSVFSFRQGGLAIYGGVIAAFLLGVLLCKWRKIKTLPLFDLVSIGFLLGQGIGRWGNFFNVEAYGSTTSLPWGMYSPKIEAELTQKLPELTSLGMKIDPTQPVHPTFLYESIWCILGFILLTLYIKHRKFDGEIFLLYLAWYGFERFFVEGLRTDSLMVGGFRISQLLAAILCVSAVAAWIYIRLKVLPQKEGPHLYAESEEWKSFLAEQERGTKDESAD